HRLRIPGGSLGAAPRGIDCRRISVDNTLVYPVFEVTRLPRLIPQAVAVLFVFTEQTLVGVPVGLQVINTKARGFSPREARAHMLKYRMLRRAPSGPRACGPEARSHVK